MTLTWKKFLDLAAIVKNLDELIRYFDIKITDIKNFNRQVAKAAQDYLDLFKDPKYLEFAKSIRIG